MLKPNSSITEMPVNFYKTWFLFTLYGWFLGFGCIILLTIPGEALGGVQFIVGLGMGIGMGYMQNRALRKIFDLKLQWMWATIAGLLIPFLVFEIFGGLISPSDNQFDVFSAIIFSGALTGIFQFFVLRTLVKKALLWILISIIAWGVVGGILWLNELYFTPSPNNPPAGLVSFFMIVFAPGPVVGLISTYGLKLIIKKFNL